MAVNKLQKMTVPGKAKPAKAFNVSFVVKLLAAVVLVNAVFLSVLAYMVLNGGGSPGGSVPVLAADSTEKPASEVMSANATNAQTDERTLQMLKEVDSDFIYENIYIGGVYVGGLTVSDAFTVLYAKLQAPVDAVGISYVKDSEENKFTFKDFGATYNISTAVEKAYAYARTGELADRYDKVQKLKTNRLDIPLTLTYDKEKLFAIVTAIAEKYSTPAVDAVMFRKDGEFFYYKEAWGVTVDAAELSEKTDLFLSNRAGGSILVTLLPSPPKYTLEMLSQATDLIGTYKTYFTPGATNRNTNIINAASFINDVVLMPDITFSTNDAFGPSTEANGYKMAGSYLAGEVVQSVGGGMCQVSSTLYAALLSAEIEIVERRNHSMGVSYIPGGMDATLAEGIIDLKFRNDTAYPITIETVLTRDSVTVNIYGRETRSADRTVKFNSVLIESIAPAPEVVTNDPTLPLGQRNVTTAEKYGARYRLEKIVYKNGVEQSRETINTSRYNPTVGRVKVGTGPALPTEEEAPPVAAAVEPPAPTPIPIQIPIPTEPPAATPEPLPAEEASPEPIIEDAPTEDIITNPIAVTEPVF
ncbi:hypothetical protein FACS189490_07540 [Clostridia bacterium]|nr:hypothetical protein FACS189490_07540 [Clostridia bacterium]